MTEYNIQHEPGDTMKPIDYQKMYGVDYRKVQKAALQADLKPTKVSDSGKYKWYDADELFEAVSEYLEMRSAAVEGEFEKTRLLHYQANVAELKYYEEIDNYVDMNTFEHDFVTLVNYITSEISKSFAKLGKDVYKCQDDSEMFSTCSKGINKILNEMSDKYIDDNGKVVK